MDGLGKAQQNAGSLLKVNFLPYLEEDYIKVEFTVSKGDYLLRKATVEDAVKYPREWAVYQATRPKVVMDGISVANLPGIKDNDDYINLLSSKGIVTAERLSALDDFTARMLHDTLGLIWRDVAKLAVAAKVPVPKVEAEKPTLNAPVAAQQQHRHNGNQRAA